MLILPLLRVMAVQRIQRRPRLAATIAVAQSPCDGPAGRLRETSLPTPSSVPAMPGRLGHRRSSCHRSPPISSPRGWAWSPQRSTRAESIPCENHRRKERAVAPTPGSGRGERAVLSERPTVRGDYALNPSYLAFFDTGRPARAGGQRRQRRGPSRHAPDSAAARRRGGSDSSPVRTGSAACAEKPAAAIAIGVIAPRRRASRRRRPRGLNGCASRDARRFRRSAHVGRARRARNRALRGRN